MSTCEELAVEARQLNAKLEELKGKIDKAQKAIDPEYKAYVKAQQELNNALATKDKALAAAKAAANGDVLPDNKTLNPKKAASDAALKKFEADMDTVIGKLRGDAAVAKVHWMIAKDKFDRLRNDYDRYKDQLAKVTEAQKHCGSAWQKKGLVGAAVLIGSLFVAVVGGHTLLAPPTDPMGHVEMADVQTPVQGKETKAEPSEQAKQQANQPLGEDPQPSGKAKKQANQPLGDPKDLEGHDTPAPPAKGDGGGQKESDDHNADEHVTTGGENVTTGDESHSWTYEYHYRRDGENYDEPSPAHGGDHDQSHRCETRDEQQCEQPQREERRAER